MCLKKPLIFPLEPHGSKSFQLYKDISKSNGQVAGEFIESLCGDDKQFPLEPIFSTASVGERSKDLHYNVQRTAIGTTSRA